MPVSIRKKTDGISFGTVGAGNSLKKQLEKTGRMPNVSLIIKPLSGGPDVILNRFLTYTFSSSVIIPVDTFSFNFVAPDGPTLNARIKEGDICVLSANNIQIAQGIVDQTEIETDAEFGENGTITGRDLMSQLEDQDAISRDNKPILAQKISVSNGVKALLANTRITKVETRFAPIASYLLATEPGESKLAALQRFLEPLNCLAWMGPNGQIIVGKPNMNQAAKGSLYLSKEWRRSNVMSMRATRASSQIPNMITPIWSTPDIDAQGQLIANPPQPALVNAAFGPARLLKLGHRLPKTYVVSAPNSTDAQGLSDVNMLTAAGNQNLLQAYVKREFARYNQKELIVQCVVPGHFNELGEPYVVDTVYRIKYDRGDVDENMYLFQVDYQLDESGGQRTNLYFCRLGTIVSDVKAP